MAFILSSGRTGTKFLARYFDANYENVVALHEPRLSRILRVASHAHLAGALSRDGLRALLRRKRSRYVEPAAAGAELYVESNPFLSGTVDLLDEVFDEPVVVHVVRDPRDHARSSLNHGTTTGLKGFANRWLPWWYPDVRKLCALPHDPGPIERAAGVWTIFNRLLRDAAPRLRHYHLVRYEDLFDAEHTGLRALCEILGLPHRESGPVRADERINPGRLDVLAPWTEWTPEECRALDGICGPLMRDLGYGEESLWRERLAGASPS